MKYKPWTSLYGILLLWAVLLCFPTVQAQEKTVPEAEACCSSIIVSDLERSLIWYRDALGFDIGLEFKNEDRGITIANLQQGRTRLELIQIATSVHPDTLSKEPQLVQGHFKFGLRLKDFDVWMEHLKEFDPGISSRVAEDPITRNRMVVIRDPDGNRIQLYEE